MKYVGRPTAGWVIFGIVTIVAIAVSASTLGIALSGEPISYRGVGFLVLLWALSIGSLVFSIALTVGRSRYVAATTPAQRDAARAAMKAGGVAKPLDYGQRVDPPHEGR